MRLCLKLVLSAAIAIAVMARAIGQPSFRGINLTSWQAGELSRPGASAALLDLRQTRVNTVMLVPTWYMNSVDSNEVVESSSQSASEADLRSCLGQATELGIKTALKPHLDVRDGSWRGLIDPAKPEDWFASYGRYLAKMAKIAADEKCELLVIGTELKKLSGRFPQKWRGLIGEIRRYFKGKVTYAANWDEYQNVCFWSDCDYLGVDAYFPLSDSAKPSLEELISAWSDDGHQHNWLATLESWHNQWSKPILFTEIGYMSWDYAARRPWSYSDGNHAYDGQLQADCYRAVIQATRDKDWLQGIFFWNWEPKSVKKADAKMSLTPQGKPAERVLLSW